LRIYCPCGRKSEDAICLKGGDKMDVAQAYQRFTTKNLAEKIKGLQGGQTVDISGLMNLDERKSQLDCDDECARQQRNRALAEALGISRPDTPEVVQYPHFVEEHGRANMKFVYFVEDALDYLVKNVAKVQSQQLSHSFAPMNNKSRRFIHELATMYGCTSISYDQEPNRNSVVTANKDSRCPRVKLSSQLQRQMNPQPPPPVPVLPEQGIGNVKFIERRKSQEMATVDYFADDL
ncbi:transcriptional repressor NF-X1-like, partial [Paramuricea clavata]